MSRRGLFCCIVTGFSISLTSVWACEIRVRDSAFRIARDTHRLCVIANAVDEKADGIHRELQQWLEGIDADFNLQVARINADDPDLNWRSIGLPSAPPVMPVTVLVGNNCGIGESFIIDHWEAAPSRGELAALVDSPVRQQLAKQLARNIAVLIFAPGPSPASSSISKLLDSMVDSGIEGERIGISVLTVDRLDPTERLLCQFMGLRPEGSDTLCVAFGRGKLMVPPLVGEAITVENIQRLIAEIRVACSCSKPLQTMGVDLPLAWSNTIDLSVILMDQDIELSELDAEVKSMLASKETRNANGAKLLAIPPGRPSSQTESVDPSARCGVTPALMGLGVVCGAVAVFVFLRGRLNANP